MKLSRENWVMLSVCVVGVIIIACLIVYFSWYQPHQKEKAWAAREAMPQTKLLRAYEAEANDNHFRALDLFLGVAENYPVAATKAKEIFEKILDNRDVNDGQIMAAIICVKNRPGMKEFMEEVSKKNLKDLERELAWTFWDQTRVWKSDDFFREYNNKPISQRLEVLGKSHYISDSLLAILRPQYYLLLAINSSEATNYGRLYADALLVRVDDPVYSIKIYQGLGDRVAQKMAERLSAESVAR